jgi:predicted transcriptional regulator
MVDMNNADKPQENDCQKMIHSEWDLIIDDLKKAGAEKVDYMKVRQPPGDKENKAIPLLLKHAEKKIHASNKESIYRNIACADWLKGELLTETIDTLFRHFENDEMLFTHCNVEGGVEALIALNKDYQGAKTLDEISTIKTRWVIGLALNALINHRLAGHKKYQARLQAILKNKKYRSGRSELVLAYARLGKQEVIQDLIDLLEEGEVLNNTIIALGNLKAKEAKPYLEKLLKHENTHFRDLARKALKKIG